MPSRNCLGLGLCLAFLTGCASTLGSGNAEVSAVSQLPRAGVVVTDPNPSANARLRSDLHFGLGLGGGKADLTCDGCVFDSRTGYSAFLSVDGKVAQNTLLGVEATGWTKERSDGTVRIWGLMAHLKQYLNRNSGLFLTAGLGVTGFRLDQTSEETTGNGLGLSGRVGYELSTGRVAVVPYVGYLRGLGSGGVDVGDAHNPTNVDIHNFQFGLAIAAR